MLLTIIAYARLPRVDSLPALVQANVTRHEAAYISLSEMPDGLVKGIIDTEDRSFYTNPGISFKGIARSVVTNLGSGKYQEGASTITQQLVREYYLSPEKTIVRKIKEALLALIVTKKFEKSEILEMYLNSIYFGHGAWGADAAARIYFNKPVGQLNLAQCTLLAGLPQAPSYLDPYVNYQAARNRQLQVLNSMEDVGDLHENEIDKIMALPLGIE
jgi:penicillin-binding protein 1A